MPPPFIHIPLLPSHRLPKSVAKQVEHFDQIKEEAYQMLDLIDHGMQGRGAIALHHAQVNAAPFNFFVINKGGRGDFKDRRIIINPKITDQKDLVPFEEGCLSYPKSFIKTRRFEHIKVEYNYPKGDGSLGLVQPPDRAFDGFAAFVFQHEFDHGQGKNIHNEFAEYNRPEEA